MDRKAQINEFDVTLLSPRRWRFLGGALSTIGILKRKKKRKSGWKTCAKATQSGTPQQVGWTKN